MVVGAEADFMVAGPGAGFTADSLEEAARLRVAARRIAPHRIRLALEPILGRR